MLHIYSFDELSDSNMGINEESLETDKEEKKKEEDQYIRELTELPSNQINDLSALINDLNALINDLNALI